MRIALIYDDTVRPDTTGVHCREALEGLAEAVHFLPRDIAQIPATGFDPYLNIDDGLRYTLRALPCSSRSNSRRLLAVSTVTRSR
jgi:hypothetical protein